LIRKGLFLAVPALLLSVAGAQADIYDFTYVGVNDPNVYGSGTFTTGTPYGNGYVPITSIAGTAEGYTITGLVAGSTEPNNILSCCGVGPGGDYFNYDNAFLPNSPNPFSASGGLLFTTSAGNGSTGYPINPINIFGDGNGNSYEFSYGEDNFSGSGPSWGGTQIDFAASIAAGPNNQGPSVTPEPSFYGTVVLCMGGMLVAARRRKHA
jgi:hypothetical protein